MNELKALAEFCANLKFEDIPEAALEVAQDSLLDFVGVCLGGSRYDIMPMISSTLREWGGTSGCRTAAVWGHGYRAPAADAALLIGMQGHILEMDDSQPDSKAHPAASIIPAAWTVCEALELNGKDLLTAIVAGYEAEARIGAAIGKAAHRKHGFHNTGTMNTFGAAAAAARAMGLTAEQLLWAFGLAGTQAAGLYTFLEHGANCKPLHPGRAAFNGIQSCLLAKSGMRGSEYILDAEDGGLFKAMSDLEEADINKVACGLGTDWKILRTNRKVFPSCGGTHMSIEYAMKLRIQGIDRDEIEKVDIYLNEFEAALTGTSEYPHTPTEAKFSTPFCFASGLIDGGVSVEQFLPEILSRPSVKALASRITVHEDPAFTAKYPSPCFRAVVVLKNGRVLEHESFQKIGNWRTPMSRDEIIKKSIRLMGPVIGVEHAKKVLSAVDHISTCSRLPDLAL